MGLTAVCLAGGRPASAHVDGDASLLADLAIFSSDLQPLTKWHRVMESMGLPDCATACPATAFFARFADLVGKPRAEQIAHVNRRINSFRYRDDVVAWGAADYWAMPWELAQRGGDCEDFAIAKYWALRSLEVPPSDLRIVVLRDLRSGENHAVLTVGAGSGIRVLDNRYNRPLRAERLPHYRAIYAVNEAGWWVHAAGSPLIASRYATGTR